MNTGTRLALFGVAFLAVFGAAFGVAAAVSGGADRSPEPAVSTSMAPH